MIRKLINLCISIVIAVVYRAYQAEGLNALLLFLPAKFIVPLLRKHGAVVGDRVEIHTPLLIHNSGSTPGKHYSHLIIGDDCYFGRDVFFDLTDKIEIADRVTVSMRATFITHTDLGKSPAAAHIPPSHAPIKLEQGVYIAASVTILQGIEIGRETIVGAGAVVVKNLPAGQTVVGVPARVTGLPNDVRLPRQA